MTDDDRDIPVDYAEQIPSDHGGRGRITEDANGRRLVPDGGVPEDLPNPDDLGRCCPAQVRYTNAGSPATKLVADAEIVTEGWLRVTGWDGKTTLYPPEKVRSVAKLETERVEEGALTVRIADDDLRERAREEWHEAIEERADDLRVVSADD